MIKEVVAVIRPSRWSDTLENLRAAGFHAVTRQRAYGRGKQKGLRYGPEADAGGILELPKWCVTLIVLDSEVEKAVAAIVMANKTGEIGDGKVFVCPIRTAVRIRTDERAELALT
jgi:nitrogen regulatory protein PII 2